MQAVVLVGGFGTRLRPLTYGTPKQMLPVANRPMLDHVVGRLAAFGVERAVLSLGYRPDAFAAAYPTGQCGGVDLHYAVEPEPLDTAGAIRFAARDAGLTETFLVLNGDVLTDLDIGALVAFHEDRGADATLALHRVDDPSRFGVVPTDDDGRVLEFVEKPPRDEAPTDLINAGTYVLEPSVIDQIPDGRKVSIERETFPSLVEGGKVFAMASDTYWLDAGTPQQFLEANLDVLAGLRGDRPASHLVGFGSRVSDTARIDNSIVGPGCRVGDGVRLSNSVIFPGVTIGPNSVVEDSILGSRAYVGEGAKIVDTCVVGDDEQIEAGATLAAVKVPDPDAN